MRVVNGVLPPRNTSPTAISLAKKVAVGAVAGLVGSVGAVVFHSGDGSFNLAKLRQKGSAELERKPKMATDRGWSEAPLGPGLGPGHGGPGQVAGARGPESFLLLLCPGPGPRSQMSSFE